MASQKACSLSRMVHHILNTSCRLTRKISPGSWSGAPVRAQPFSSFRVHPPAVSWSCAAPNRLGADTLDTRALLRFSSARIWHVVTLEPQMDHRGSEANRPSFGCPPNTPTTTPNKPIIHVAPVTEDDYDQLVAWTHTVMCRGDPVLDYIFPYPERASEDIPQTLEAFTDPSCRTFKAVLKGSKGESDRMVGYVRVAVHGENWVDKESTREGGR